MTSWAVIPMVLCFAMNAAAQPAASKAPQRQTYQSADVDADGNLRIITSDHRTIIVPKAKDQTSFERVAISSDHAAVGALETTRTVARLGTPPNDWSSTPTVRQIASLEIQEFSTGILSMADAESRLAKLRRMALV